jgi:hypothetical protein
MWCERKKVATDDMNIVDATKSLELAIGVDIAVVRLIDGGAIGAYVGIPTGVVVSGEGRVAVEFDDGVEVYTRSRFGSGWVVDILSRGSDATFGIEEFVEGIVAVRARKDFLHGKKMMSFGDEVAFRKHYECRKGQL